MVTPGCLKGWGNEWRVCSLVLPTPSLLSLVHNSLHSQLLATVFTYLPGFFFVVVVFHTRGHFDCTPQHFSHSPAHLSPPPTTDTHMCTNATYRGRNTWGRLNRHGHIDTHSLNYPLFDTHSQKHIFWNHKAPSFFFPSIICNNRNRLKRPAGGYLLQQSAITSAPITARHRPTL